MVMGVVSGVETAQAVLFIDYATTLTQSKSPQMTLFQKKVSNVGVSHPVVARTIYQAPRLMEPFRLSDDLRNGATAVIQALAKHLIGCQEIADEVLGEIDKCKAEGLRRDSRGNSVQVPHVVNLSTKVEHFLYRSKLGLRDLSTIFKVFYGEEFGARYDRILNWARSQFGEESYLSKLLDYHHDYWIKQVVDMRNAIEHPRDDQKLIIHNFQLRETDGGVVLEEPTWNLTGGMPGSILKDLPVIIENMLRLSEELLIFCVKEHDPDSPILIVEVPVEERNRNIPVRFRTTLDPDKVRLGA